ncbi:hypothetical protein Bca4012_030847 [Brassica carinata]|uniref:(rape) hypothetical protein n=1 Tax=Brassica napus TaxID=3708 RepID=A0A816JAD6_BRANA|nr:unnamed protein product [Brassica napus]
MLAKPNAVGHPKSQTGRKSNFRQRAKNQRDRAKRDHNNHKTKDRERRFGEHGKKEEKAHGRDKLAKLTGFAGLEPTRGYV